jgi:hypothetical protein
MIREVEPDFDGVPVAEASPWLNTVSRTFADPARTWWSRDKVLGDFAGHIQEHIADLEYFEDD